MKPNVTKQLLAADKVPVGHMLMEFATRGMARITEAAGLDFILIDMEHSGLDHGRIADLIAWYKATPIAPFVRVPDAGYHWIARLMDAGALGIMVPNVQNADEAKRAVDAMKYAPMGARGLGLGSAHNDYKPPQPREYFEYANANTTLICQIESEAGLDHLEAIAQTPGVDVLWVGHFDLTQSMGIVAEFQNPKFLNALRRVAEVARKYGKAAGIQPGNVEMARQWMEIGFNMISFGSDFAVYQNALRSAVGSLRSLGGPV
jgi:2-keto-3-deoxy-L-rhamnonate aldolase RhmA